MHVDDVACVIWQGLPHRLGHDHDTQRPRCLPIHAFLFRKLCGHVADGVPDPLHEVDGTQDDPEARD